MGWKKTPESKIILRYTETVDTKIGIPRNIKDNEEIPYCERTNNIPMEIVLWTINGTKPNMGRIINPRK